MEPWAGERIERREERGRREKTDGDPVGQESCDWRENRRERGEKREEGIVAGHGGPREARAGGDRGGPPPDVDGLQPGEWQQRGRSVIFGRRLLMLHGVSQGQ